MPLPWTEVNARAGFEVAKLLEPYGLAPARRERYKWACPMPGCNSSDAFHTYKHPGRRSRCFVCETRLTNVDLAALVRGERPGDACRWLAGQLGIHVELRYSRPSPAGTRPRPATPTVPAQPPKPPQRPAGFDPAGLYADVLGRTTLTPAGAAYLRRRGIPPEFAREYGFRSVDGPSGWAALRRHLAAAYSRDSLRAAGFARDEHGRVWTPFGGLVPMLIIPFRQGEKTIFLRMRTVGPPPGRLIAVIPDWAEKWNRYRAPVDVLPPLPFNADALPHRIVHLIEGELNALTLLLPAYRLHSIGTPGAGVLQREWVNLLGSADLVVTWYDSDTAGRLARDRANQAFGAAHGSTWVEDRLFHMDLPPGRDVNQLHVEGALPALVRAAPWRSKLHQD